MRFVHPTLWVVCVGVLASWTSPTVGFSTLYEALNATDTVSGNSNGIEVVYMPVYSVASIDRILSVVPQEGQFSAVVELLLEWRDTSAFATMLNSTARMRTDGSRCYKPCTSGNLEGICCDEIFTINLQFANAASPPDIVTNIYFDDGGRVVQTSMIYGTFYQDFRLKDYPFSYLPADISVRLNPSVYKDPAFVSILPVPLSAQILGHNAGQGSSGWYATDPVLRSNKPGYARKVTSTQILTNNTKLMDFRGAVLESSTIVDKQNDMKKMVAQLDSATPTLDIDFYLYVSSVQAFSLTLPLVLLALLNLAVFLLPLSGLSNRVQFCITLFFTTSTTLLTQSFGGSQLNSVQRLAVVIFTMLTFTVFSSILNHGLNMYMEGKVEVKNDFEFLRRGKRAKITKNVQIHNVKHVDLSNEIGNSVSFGQRFHDDKDFRLAFVRFLDRLCLLVTFVVYVVTFSIICTDSSKAY